MATKLQAMQTRIGPSEAFIAVVSEEEQNDEIFEERLSNPRAGVSVYYGSVDEDGL